MDFGKVWCFATTPTKGFVAKEYSKKGVEMIC
jgi:hypothetical protein